MQFYVRFMEKFGGIEDQQEDLGRNGSDVRILDTIKRSFSWQRLTLLIT